MEDLVGGEHLVPFRRSAPRLLSSAVDVLLSSGSLLSTPKFATAVRLNGFHDVAVHVEVLDGFFHGKDGVVLVFQEVYEAPSARLVDD